MDRNSFKQLITVQKIVEPRLDFLELSPFADSSSDEIHLLQEGAGSNKNVFVYGSKVRFNVTKQERDLKYEFNLGVASQTINGASNVAEFVYPSAGHFNVTAVVHNQLGMFGTSRMLIIRRPIHGLAVYTTPSEIHLGKKMVLYLNATDFGSEIRGEVSFGDGIVYIVNHEEKETDDNARDELNELNQKNVSNKKPPKGDPSSDQTLQQGRDDEASLGNIKSNMTYRYVTINDVNQTISHVYKQKGFFNVTVHLENDISAFHRTTELLVIHKVCPDAVVHFLNTRIGTEESPVEIQKSDATLFKSNVEFDCPLAGNTSFLWQVVTAPTSSKLNKVNDNGAGQVVLETRQQSPYPLGRVLNETIG